MKISENTDISVIRFYGYIGNIGKISMDILTKISVDILTKISINNKLFKNYKYFKGFQKTINK